MPYHFTPLNRVYAETILTWKYDGPYAFYDYHQSSDHILKMDAWGSTLFAALDESGNLIGELTIGFLDQDEEWVPQAEMDACHLDHCILWIGFGMRPDLTGHGLGLSFVNACVDFSVHMARDRYRYSGEYIGLGVYCFNQRAIKVYERAGFIKFKDSSSIKKGVEYKAQRMKKRIDCDIH